MYNLNAEKLREARQIVQEAALKDYSAELARGKGIKREERIEAAKSMIREYMEGESAYSAAVLGYLRLFYPTHNL